MTNTYITRMLQFLTVVMFLGHMTYWKIQWGWESSMTTSMEWLCGILYGAGNIALMWGMLFALDRYYRKNRLGKYS